jgi:hypothetical protein
MRADAVADTEPTWLAEPALLEAVLVAAGFGGVSVEPIRVPMVFGSDPRDAADFLFGMGPVRHHLTGADPATVGRARAEVTANLRAFQTADGVVLHSDFWLVRATRLAPPG